MKLHELIEEHEGIPSEAVITLIGQKINDKIITLKTCNEEWHNNFDCSSLALTTIKGSPKRVIGYFDCSNNDLTSLEGAPKEVIRDFHGSSNYLKSLEGISSIIGLDVNCSTNQLTNLKDIHKMITKMNGDFYCWSNPIESHVLGLLLIPGLKRIRGGMSWCDILNRYIGKGRAGLIECQNELIEAGLEEYAQL